VRKDTADQPAGHPEMAKIRQPSLPELVSAANTGRPGAILPL